MKFRLTSKWQNYLTAYWMIFPSLVLYLIFVIYPMGRGFWVSLHQWDGLSDMKWIGLKNYLFVLNDKVFWGALKNTFIFSIGVTVIKNLLGLILALLLNQQIRGRTFFRSAAFMPVTFAFVVIGVLWSWIYNPVFGLLNNTLKAAGLDFLIQGWLSNPKIALLSVMTVDIWKWTGFHMVLLLAGLQSIPQEFYEAASIDGAGRWHRFVHITLPLINEVLAVSIVMSIIGAFASNYDVVYVMTGGGPFHATEVALTWIVNTTFRFAAVGKANAMSMILFVCVAFFGTFQLLLLTRNRTEM